jgi:hypothetical protein
MDWTSTATAIAMNAIGEIRRIAPNLRAVSSGMRSEKLGRIVYPQIIRFYPQKTPSGTSHTTREYL